MKSKIQAKKLNAKILYIVLLLAWSYMTIHYWEWLRNAPFVDWYYMVVETWMLWSLTMFSLIILHMIRELSKGG